MTTTDSRGRAGGLGGGGLGGNERAVAPAETDPATQSPSSPIWHGLGLFGESYLLFSVGTLRPLWEALYPSCFDADDVSECHPPYLSYKSMTYSVVLGVMVGMVVVGALASRIGRRRGSILTAALMASGSVCLALCSALLSSRPSTLFPAMSLSLFVFGFGVGGEYPMSASSASERAMVEMKKRQRNEGSGGRIRSRMKRLLSSSSSQHPGECPTPQHANLSAKRGKGKKALGEPGGDDKRQSLLSVDTIATSAATHNKSNNNKGSGSAVVNPWQTLDSRSEDGSYFGDVPLSPTDVTKETANSLATANARLRSRGREVLLVFSMQGVGIFANSMVRYHFSVSCFVELLLFGALY